jgi:hypothetical protein
MRAFMPKRGILPAVEAACRKNRIGRIRRLRVRLADGWRHMRWEAALYETERELCKAGEG